MIAATEECKSEVRIERLGEPSLSELADLFCHLLAKYPGAALRSISLNRNAQQPYFSVTIGFDGA